MSTSCESIAGLVIKKDATVGDFMERETTHVAKQAQFDPKWLKINDLTRTMEYCSRNFGHPCTECETTVQNRVTEKLAETSAKNVCHLESGDPHMANQQFCPKFRAAKCKTENVHT